MKKAVLLILCSFGVSFLSAQIKLDSVITNGDHKIAFTYDGEGNTVESVEYEWDIVDNTWRRKFRTTCVESATEMTTTQYRWWDTNPGQWVGLEKDSCFISPSGSECYNFIWNVAYGWLNNWKSTSQIIYQDSNIVETEQINGYQWINNAWTLHPFSTRLQLRKDAEGRILEVITASRDTSTSSWSNYDKETCEYDTSGQITDKASYNWSTDANEWQGNSRSSYTYENNKLLSETRFNWDENDNFWKVSSRYIHTYNAYDDLTSSELYLFDTGLGDWVFERPQASYSYAYTAEGSVGEKIESYWHEPSNAMVYAYKTNYTYDEAGNVINYASYNWNFFLENWYNANMEIKEYDLTSDTTELIYPSSLPPSYSYWSETSKLISREQYILDAIFNDWQLSSKSFFYFSEFTTATNEPAAEALKLFPNPVSDLITLGTKAPKASSYQITDLNGRVLQHEKSWNGEGIDVSRLIPGSYVIRLIEGNRVVTGKVIKS